MFRCVKDLKMTKQKPITITLRFNETVDYLKLVKMSKQNNRSINSEILWAIQNRLKQFEIINNVKK